MKKTLGFLLLFSGITANAANLSTGEMKATANVSNSCFVSVPDYHLGEINTNVILKQDWDLQCSKNTTVKMSITGLTNPAGHGAQFMTIGGEQVEQLVNDTATKAIGTGIRYTMVTGYAEDSTEDYTMIHRPYTNGLMKDFGGVWDYTMTIKTISGNKFQMPIAVKLIDFEENLHRFKAGNYFDILTLHLEY